MTLETYLPYESTMSKMNHPNAGVTTSATQSNNAAGAPMRVIRMPEVKQRIGLSRSKIYTLIASNDFPRKIHLGLRAIGFLSNEIDMWIEARVMAGAARHA